MAYSPEDPNSRYWDRQFEEGLPDCRLRGPERRRQTVVRGSVVLERVFCANCGCNGGAVTAHWTPHVFYVCTECSLKLGPPPGFAAVPPAIEKHIRREDEAPPLR